MTNRFSKWLKVVLLLLLLPVAWEWYVVAADYDYPALSGTYIFDGAGEYCSLSLRPDGTFTEELTQHGRRQSANGTWHRYGLGHVSFSNDFVTLPGQKLNGNGQSHGQFSKTLGFFPTLTLAPLPDGPTFHKKLFR
jgi:hypothetical protein